MKMDECVIVYIIGLPNAIYRRENLFRCYSEMERRNKISTFYYNMVMPFFLFVKTIPPQLWDYSGTTVYPVYPEKRQGNEA